MLSVEVPLPPERPAHRAQGRGSAPLGEDRSACVVHGSGLCASATALASAGRGKEAIALTREAVVFVRGLFGTARPQELRRLSGDLAALKATLSDMDLRIEAAKVAHDVVSFARAAAESGRRDDVAVLADSVHGLALALSEVGRVSQAATLARETVTLRRELARDRRGTPLQYLANALRDHGRWLGRAGGDAEEASRLLQEALVILQSPACAGAVDARADVAKTHHALATHWGDRGRPDEALPPGLVAVALYRERMRANVRQAEIGLAKALHNLGIWLSQAGRPADALTAAEESVGCYWRLVATRSPGSMRDLAWSLVTLGNRLREARRHLEAQYAFREAGALLLVTPVHDAHLWVRLASVVATTLSQPQDLREFLLPLLRRLALLDLDCTDEAAASLATLREAVAARVRMATVALPLQLDELIGDAATVVLAPELGEHVARWARAHRVWHLA